LGLHSPHLISTPLPYTRLFRSNHYIDPTGTHDITGDGGGTVAPVGWDLGALTLGTHNDYTISSPLPGGSMFDVTLTWFRDRDVKDRKSTRLNSSHRTISYAVFC